MCGRVPFSTYSAEGWLQVTAPCRPRALLDAPVDELPHVAGSQVAGDVRPRAVRVVERRSTIPPRRRSSLARRPVPILTSTLMTTPHPGTDSATVTRCSIPAQSPSGPTVRCGTMTKVCPRRASLVAGKQQFRAFHTAVASTARTHAASASSSQDGRHLWPSGPIAERSSVIPACAERCSRPVDWRREECLAERGGRTFPSDRLLVIE